MLERMKRQQNEIIEYYHANKKQKLYHQYINTTKSVLEDLANEIIYEIFDYLDIFHIYDGFFDLNKRFKKLLNNSNLPIQVNISTISKANFQRYYKNIIIPNRHRINYLRLSNPFTTDIVFSPSRLITQFSQIESLILDNIIYKSFKNISTYLTHLPKLHSLILSFTEKLEYENIPFGIIFSLSNLKYFKITYKETNEYEPHPIYFTDYGHSSIEYLVINTYFHVESFNNLLFCFPKLRYLKIDCLRSSYRTANKINKEKPIALEYLKFVSLKLDFIDLNHIEDSFKKFFYYVNVLQLTTKRYSFECLNAKSWEQLISIYMPNLRVYDVNYYGCGLPNQETFHELVNQFNSSFWISKQWFFTHQHDWQENLNKGILYSTNPYRSKDYKFYWQSDRQPCPYLRKTYFKTVKHVLIDSKRVTNNQGNYFPNTTQLTITNNFETLDDLFPIILNRIIPVKNLTKIVIESFSFPLEQIINLIRFTPNLHTLKFYLIFLKKIKTNIIEQSQIFQYISKTNKIKNLDLHDDCSLERIQLIMKLFPKLESMKIGMKKKETNEIARFILSNNNIQTGPLTFLCMSQVPRRCLKEINILIKSENLVNDYCIKYFDRDLYLWW
ncbi:unnamed protein product [Rotaria sordida]|uniref:F-box domain-containing protein n=1 Tax=Rotaria sordida TaxID=392033 RepID=A0A815M906_9BILA|nr:unnamed protein product [Rotaria sordida]CAF3971528.1 unnamed protein product [Rotaria sordida]